jgi:hypothetical protein
MLSFPLTDAQFAAASTRLRAYGVDLSGPTGTIAKEGITAKYVHANDTLTVEIVDKPFFIPQSLIESKLKDYFQKAMANLETT